MLEDNASITVGPTLPPAHPLPNVREALTSNAPQARRELVPEPPHRRNRSYIGYIRSDHLPKYLQAKDVIKRLVRILLNINVSWRFQEARAVERLKAKILRRFPMFKDYEGAWPVMYYAYQKLGDFRRCLDWTEPGPTRRRVSTHILNRQPCSTCLAGGQMGATRRPPGRAEQAAVADNVVAAADVRTTDDRQCQYAPALPVSSAATGVQAPPRRDRGSGAYSPSDRRLAAMIELAKQDEKDVLEFLCSIGNTFGYLIDRFRVAGLTSRARLAALAEWSEGDVDAFLVSEVRLSAFERRAVKVALGKLAG